MSSTFNSVKFQRNCFVSKVVAPHESEIFYENAVQLLCNFYITLIRVSGWYIEHG